MSDVTYITLAEQREANLRNRIKWTYCKYVNPDILPEEVTVKPFEDSAGEYTAFWVNESGKTVYQCSIWTTHYKRVCSGHEEPKISSKFFKKI